MQARGIAQPRIPALAHACVAACQQCTCSRGHPPAPSRLCAQGHQVSGASLQPCSQAHCPASQGPHFLPLAGKLEVYRSPPPPPQVLPLEIPRRTSGNQGLPPSSCSLHCLEVRLVPSSSAALGFRCPANFWHRVTKGKPAPARRVGGANPEEPPVPRRLRPQGWISDFHREGAEGTGDLTHTLQLTNGPAFSLRATSSK